MHLFKNLPSIYLCAMPCGVGDHGPKNLPVSRNDQQLQRCCLQPFAQGVRDFFPLSTPTSTTIDLSRRDKMFYGVSTNNVANKFCLQLPDVVG